ncbi:tRNA (adenosine(37)-N6)-dimethylallyltransferase MiaA [Candidatus Kaiserbacteria bacterium CG10_big_fil_rev_8_21_14_0_10_43_70]|uniref:tRNA dimethylallyltransferase n=1 Tax=Candidatus Kaiserbacteria bacterium CG10_big_fil_rev_8_21_14_0_10_43_70 TaxID=1974605 RepID=A0A2H0UJF8_9BACT|nr:MAG: tRNA (adenosine(37)-N6)-dimethylallyltransferase MiaA [Candidatus Kaiserbacteria bacterium CG10_big_fil_rev_8_21_14_0_10_43_70]
MVKKIIVIVGPTASGKSDLAVAIAKKFNGEIISADSRQVYKGLDIGTGKITKREMKSVPHHLLDVASPKRRFTAYDFVQHANGALTMIYQSDKIPIITGGTGFYIDALVGNIAIPQLPPNEPLRERLEGKKASELFEMLKSKDPKRARTIEKSNKRRLIRALEITKELGSVPPFQGYPLDKKYDVLWIGIEMEKDMLRKKIHTRLLERLKKGMVAEAKKLHEKGLSYKRMEELGLEYKYLALFLKSKITKEEMIEQLSAKIWQYARRQMTYWRRNKDIRWVLKSEKQKIEMFISDFLKI